MATSENAKIQFEVGKTVTDYTAMTDSGDHTVFTAGTVWSNESGYEPSIRPNGVVTGRNIVSTHATNDTVTIAAFTAYSGGTLYSVTATTTTVTRAASDVAQIHSITMNSSGSIAVVEGEDSADTTLSEVRGAAGGPPSIPADSVEIAQVRLTGNTPAAIASTEIFQDDNTHCERSDFPVVMTPVNTIGDGLLASVPAKKNSYVELSEALPLIHGTVATDAADAYKKIYIKYYTPSYAEVTRAVDFQPVVNSHTVKSTQVYNGVVGAKSSSIGQGGFKAFTSDNITDAILGREDKVTTIKHYPDRNKTPYTLTQGTLGINPTNPADDENYVDVTITATVKTARFSS